VLVPLFPDAAGSAHDALYLSLILCPECETTGEAQVALGAALEVASASVDDAELVTVPGALCQPDDFGICQCRGRCPSVCRVLVMPSEELVKLVGRVLGLPDRDIAHDVTCHGEETP
jgi:hypothetical protein